MIAIISSTAEYFYKNIAKPLLFKLSPDSAHTSTAKAGILVSKVPPLLWLLRVSFAYDNQTILSQTINGIYYRNPVGLSAGFDKNFELLKFLPSLGFGFVEGGSLTLEASKGNPRPHYRRLKESKSILVNAGLNNDGANLIVERILKYKDISYPLNISVAKTNSPGTCTDEQAVNDYIGSLNIINKAKVGQIVTINISCPNAYGGEPFNTPNRLKKLLLAIDKLALDQPIFIKMPIDLSWNDFDALLKIIVNHKIAGVTIGNLAKNRNNPALKDVLTVEHKGNMSGKPTYELSNALIGKTYQGYGDKLIIIGVGGIFNATDAYEKIKQGATLVELITGLIFEGPQIIGTINKDLVKLLKADGYTNISEAIGANYRN